ncbi:MAG: efflux RND transporter periplasmic adaptor subunit [Planctomycetia bacterium]|nr:efflux RND transporter periplasmic adaptor subunit [Planctomycetia bacterium]
MRAIGSIIVAALGLACLAASGCSHAASEALHASSEPTAVPVTVATAERRPTETTIDVVGTLKGWEDVKVGAKKSGRVVRVMHDVGDQVKPGEPLVQLETVHANLMVQQAEKRLASELAKLGLKELPQGDFDVARLPTVMQAQVAVDRARQKYTREQSLAEKKVNTVESLQDAEFNLRDALAHLDNTMLQARATLAAAVASKVELDVSRKALEDMAVEAPEPSKPPENLKETLLYALTKRSVSEGQMLREGEEVMQLVIDNPLRMWANVPERFSPYVHSGLAVRLTVPSYPDRTFEGTVTWVNPAIDSASNTFQVEVAVANDDRQLRPGGFAKAAIVVRRADDRTVVPIESVVRFAGVTKVFVVRDDKAFAVPVTTGVEGTGWIEVDGDVPPDAIVVVTGQSQLADGTPVVVRGGPREVAPAETPPDERHVKRPDATAG